MKQLMVPFLCLLICVTACTSGNNKAGKESAGKDTTKYFATTPFFTQQIQYVDLRNFPIYRITMIDGKKDSVALSKEEFIKWAGVFLEKDISAPKTAAGYKESVFNDLSTGSITLNYSPINGEANIQNIDILLAQETNQVKRILIRSVFNRGDTLVTESCSWKADKSFQVNRSYITKSGYNKTELNFINWNDKP